MSKTWQKKDWLKANGFIKEVTRGRISGENHKRLSEAVANGVKFSDYTAVKTEAVEKTSKGTTTKTVRVIRDGSESPSVPGDTAWISMHDMRFPEAEYIAISETGEKFGMREACNNCHLSLLNHKCESPSVLGKRVKIVMR